MLGQLNIRMQKKEVGTFMLTLGMKINSKWITDLNGRARTIDTIKKSEKTTHNTCCNMANGKKCVNYVSHKGLVSRIYKKHLQMNNKKTIQFKNGQGLSWWSALKTPSFHCRGRGFDPWSGTKIPHAAQCSQKSKNK